MHHHRCGSARIIARMQARARAAHTTPSLYMLPRGGGGRGRRTHASKVWLVRSGTNAEVEQHGGMPALTEFSVL